MRNLVINRIIAHKPAIFTLGFDYPSKGGTLEELQAASDEELLDFLEVITNFLQEHITYKEAYSKSIMTYEDRIGLKSLLEQFN